MQIRQLFLLLLLLPQHCLLQASLDARINRAGRGKKKEKNRKQTRTDAAIAAGGEAPLVDMVVKFIFYVEHSLAVFPSPCPRMRET